MAALLDYHKLKYRILQHFWGHENFRDLQEEIIDSVISGKDTLALLPTGGGKSLCYQIPALLLEGTAIVISPLLALMKDQVLQLQRKGIEAEYLSSELDDFEAENVYGKCREGITKILYVSPERLTNRIFLENLQDIQLSIIAVDEAHCISEWGQDFRPSYQNILQFRETYPLPCIALTATATDAVLKQIKERLGLKKPAVFQKSFKRDNLIIIPEKIADKYQRIADLLHHHQESGLIYTRTRKEAEDLAGYLQSRNLSNVDYFHAGLPVQEKNRRQNWWLHSPKNVLVSTNAFGMGIDKDQVRFVIHYSPAATVENYYQEIGRAGRDGKQAFAYLLWNEQELLRFDDILKSQIPDKNEFLRIVTHLYSAFQVAEHELPENQFQLHLQRLKNTTKLYTGKITNVLNFLHNQEYIFWQPHKSLSSLELKMKPDDIDLLPRKDSYFAELLLRNLPGLNTHRVTFSETALCKKLNTDPPLLKERIRELAHRDLLEYHDGAVGSVRFLKHRNDNHISGKLWSLFQEIQKNKVKKWEEMKFYLRNDEYCKMKLILSYFGEKSAENCGKCSVCMRSGTVNGRKTVDEIMTILAQKPATADELAIQLFHLKKEKILENLILLLDTGKVKMLNFRTYTLA